MFFASPRWAILEIIAKKPSSPVEISQKVKTSVSYVSQQLKLLEAAGLVVKEKTGSADKGKPRLVYSISKEILQVTGMLRGFPVKKIIAMDEHHKTVLRIWALEDKKLHRPLEKFYWALEDKLKDVVGVFADLSDKEIFVVSDSKRLQNVAGVFEGLKVKIVSEKALAKQEGLYPIYDPNFLDKKLKGGEEG